MAFRSLKAIIYLDSLLLLFGGPWKVKPNIWYRKRNITAFIFPSKNAETLDDSLYQLKLFVFDRDSIKKKNTL